MNLNIHIQNKKYKTLDYNDLHDSFYNEHVKFTPISHYGDCEFSLYWTDQEFDVYKDEEPETEHKIASTLYDALKEVQNIQRDINGELFDVMNTDDCVMEMLDRWALETCGLWLQDMTVFYIDIKLKDVTNG